MASNNLPTMLINIWFSPLVAGYFSVVSRFCLSPVMIIGNAVRNSIFLNGRWIFVTAPLTIQNIKSSPAAAGRRRGVHPWYLDFLSAGDAPGL